MFLISRQQGRSETEEYSSDSESESEDEEELQMILEDLQKQNEELEVRKQSALFMPFDVTCGVSSCTVVQRRKHDLFQF